MQDGGERVHKEVEMWGGSPTGGMSVKIGSLPPASRITASWVDARAAEFCPRGLFQSGRDASAQIGLPGRLLEGRGSLYGYRSNGLDRSPKRRRPVYGKPVLRPQCRMDILERRLFARHSSATRQSMARMHRSVATLRIQGDDLIPARAK